MRKALCLAAAGAALWLAPGALASGWCGTGESATDRPDITTGAQVHAIVATPSDSADQFAADANTLADDVDFDVRLVDDPGPDPRPALRPGDLPERHLPRHLVLAAAAAGERLPGHRGLPARSRTRSRAAGSSEPVQGLRRLLRRAFSGRRTSAAPAAATFDQGGGFAIVWLNGCARRPERQHRDPRAAARARGGLLRRPRTTARRRTTIHPCDSSLDVLYPFATPGVTSGAARARLQPRRLLRPQRQLARHPGLDLPASPRHPARGARCHAGGAWRRDERPARRQLPYGVHDAVGSGNRRGADGHAGDGRALRALDGQLLRQRRMRRRPQPARLGDGGVRSRDGLRSRSPPRAKASSRARRAARGPLRPGAA